MGKFYQFKAVAPMKGALYLYGEIASEAVWGDEVTAAQFQKDLNALGKIDALDLHINSVGGDVWAGMAIYSILSRLDAKITTYVDGLAASIASIIAMAGEKIVMPKNATMMIHQSMANPAGNKAKLRAIADELERIDGQQVEIFARKTGKKPDEIAKMMETDYFMTGAEAFEQGFSDELEEPRRLVACAGFAEFIARYETPPVTDIEPEELEAAEQGGFSLPADGAKARRTVTIFGQEVDEGTRPRDLLDGINLDAPVYADNGGESQPVADTPKPDGLKEQRSHFDQIKRKILEA